MSVSASCHLKNSLCITVASIHFAVDWPDWSVVLAMAWPWQWVDLASNFRSLFFFSVCQGCMAVWLSWLASHGKDRMISTCMGSSPEHADSTLYRLAKIDASDVDEC